MMNMVHIIKFLDPSRSTYYKVEVCDIRPLKSLRKITVLTTDSSERSTSPVDDFDSEAQEPSRKKARTIFTTEQLRGLEGIFTTQRYLSAGDRAMVARKLHLTEFQVLIRKTD